MAGCLKILDGGTATSLQDAGRPGYRRLGVAVSGALDPLLLACANALVGNPADATALEMRFSGPRLEVARAGVRLALAGSADVRVIRGDGSVDALSAWRCFAMEAGDVLHVGSIRSGVAYLAIAGGIDLATELGSHSTYVRARIGGIDGRTLRDGDIIPGASNEPRTAELAHARGFVHKTGPIRVLLGPQEDYFTREALAEFTASPYTVTRDFDRMGIRLAGALLAHAPARGAEIVSDGVTPGAIQVPADGQPILLLADCQTVGGYPKMATVISADLPRLAHLLPGMNVHFVAVTRAVAHAALLEQGAALRRWKSELVPHRPAGEIDEAALYSANLVSGVVDIGGEAT